MRPFEQAYLEYGKVLRERDIADQKYCWEEHRNFAEATQEAHQDLQTELQEAWRRYVEATQAGGEQGAEPTAPGPVLSAYSDYVSETQQAHADSRQTAAECLRNYRQAMNDGWYESMEARQDAFRGYVDAVKEAWAGLDPAETDPATLASIAQTLVSAASIGARYAAGVATGPRPTRREAAAEGKA